MRVTRLVVHLVVVVVLVAVAAGLARAQGPQVGEGGATPQGVTAVQEAVGTAFTYQGRLTDGGNPANGTYDFEFKLYDGSDPDTATQVGGTVTKEDVTVTDGLFTVDLDFGSVFDGTALWLQIGVRPGSSTDAFTALSPLQPLTPAPYAMSLRPQATVRDPSTTGVTPALSVQSDSTSSNAVALLGEITSSSPGSFSAAVRGINRGTSGLGIGVWGSQEGSGWGVYGTSPSGRGVYGSSTSGTGVYGSSESGNAGYFSANSTTSTATVRLHERANDYARLEFSNTNAARRWHIAGYIGSTQADDRLNIWNSAGGNILRLTGDGKVGIMTNNPQNRLHVVGNIVGAASPNNHVVQIENTANSTNADGLAIVIQTAGNPTGANNYITFFKADGPDAGTAPDSVGAIEGDGSGGVTLAGPGSDYAEWLPMRLPNERLEAGDIVAWTPEGITRQTGQAIRLMVISTSPIVAGNAPMGDRSGWKRVAFVGQVPVKVRGPVRAGDFIVPSGRNDGTGVAVAPERLRLEQVNQVVGQALESASGNGVHKVKVLVGLPPLRITQVLLAARDAQLAQQQAQLAALEKRVETLERGGGWARQWGTWLPNVGTLGLAGLAFWLGRRHRGKEERS